MFRSGGDLMTFSKRMRHERLNMQWDKLILHLFGEPPSPALTKGKGDAPEGAPPISYRLTRALWLSSHSVCTHWHWCVVALQVVPAWHTSAAVSAPSFRPLLQNEAGMTPPAMRSLPMQA